MTRTRDRIAIGAAIGIGADTLAHTLDSHVAGVILAFALVVFAMTLDLTLTLLEETDCP